MLLAEVVAPLQVPVWIDLAAVVVGALAGASRAVQEKLDAVGVLFLAVVMGLGGGIVRDVLLDERPVALTDGSYLPTVAAAAAVGFFASSVLRRAGRLLLVLDALAIGLFTVVGVEKALLAGLSAAPAMLIGVAAAIGGGIVRDLIVGSPVEVIRRGPWNAAAALAGSGGYVVLERLGAAVTLAESVSFAIVVGARLLSVWRGWETPLPVDLARTLRTRAARTRPATRSALNADRPSPDTPGDR